MESDPKPCPFCGKEVKWVEHDTDCSRIEENLDVACGTHDCYLEYGADWWLTEKELIDKWNNRPGLDAILNAAYQAGVGAERERCAVVAENTKFHGPYQDEGGEAYYQVPEFARRAIARAIRKGESDAS
jgi:hypothetical protein